ncbi:hypothetical protein [Uliginosibacterium aquaticum]|uniref:Glutamine amidotransferase type-2 domain-containing protein n=1 Tax=Uliginosibacterium aquaticum TaxID=2731212 RepID=A0ABX2IDD5_9RHOO|nr:hypothetical protein [Uliginosibacterium aquaticum]NSL53758.1 hypothetical protein [Uliginosibacterium aquaticum]
MCGIFGFVASDRFSAGADQLGRLAAGLFLLSESRGSEAAGLAISNGVELSMFRRAQPASRMLGTPEYKEFVGSRFCSTSTGANTLVIGHSRLVTNGSQGIEENNQPVSSDHCVGVHNGIIVNDKELWELNPDLVRRSLVDTEVFYRLFDKNFSLSGDVVGSLCNVFGAIKGEANIAFLHDSMPSLFLATNVGSLYWLRAKKTGLFVFASERHFLTSLILQFRDLFSECDLNDVQQLRVGEGVCVSPNELSIEAFELSAAQATSLSEKPVSAAKPILDHSPKRKELCRCTRCILPHSFPFISFDKDGVCNFCREGAPIRRDDRQTLEARISGFRSKDGSPDCIVALSGGRDSCYGLHVIKKELGLNPIAYTYDWAMVTDEARRNSARMCGELGVEHIIRSADIISKRKNIRINIEAWLRRPELGMIPLFMAGDKQFFHYASQVSRQTSVPLVIFCGGNNLEITRFKAGFCGVQDRSVNTMVGLDLPGKLRLLAYYAKNYILNPSYINRSVLDTLFAFYSTYVNRQDFLYLYQYVDWDEKVIAKTLSDSYGWESSGDSNSTWRIGDGTAAFYNYIYYTVAGFSEHDTFRSNQIRAGLITRDEALRLVEQENQPRYLAMREYAALVGFSLDEALTVINNIPKLG